MGEEKELHILRFDGASKGNPGEGGAGACLFYKGKVIAETCRYLGEDCTNNQAEYHGLIIGLELTVSLGIERLLIQGDSKLVILQVSGKWKINNPKLRILYDEVMELMKVFKHVELEYIPRSMNAEADLMANKSISHHRTLSPL